MENNISDATLGRLFRYYKYLCEQRDSRQTRTSSAAIGEALGLTASQVRQDFNALGCLGHHGYGYQIHQLIEELRDIAKLDRQKSTVIIGAGALGRAVASNLNFGSYGFHLVALFDSRQSVTGQIIRDLPVRHLSDLDEFCRDNKVQTAIICQPSGAAALAHQLSKAGVKGIWNLGGGFVEDIDGVEVLNLDLQESLLRLSFLME